MHALTIAALIRAVRARGVPLAGGGARTRRRRRGLAHRSNWSIRNVFRVCADPRNLPFSDEARRGLREQAGRAAREKLGTSRSYTYYPQVIGFVRNTLNALKLRRRDGRAQGDDLVQTTIPTTTRYYALVFKPEARPGRRRRRWTIRG